MTVYEARAAGRDYCNDTQGSDHYKGGEIEPLDLMISKGLAEDFCIGSVIKYIVRYKNTRNPDDLRKVSDYAQILCGMELRKTTTDKAVSVMPLLDRMAATEERWKKEN